MSQSGRNNDDITLLIPEEIGNFSVRSRVLEAMLDLSTKNLKFSEFVHDLLVALVDAAKAEAGSILEADYAGERIFFRAAVGLASPQLMDFEIPMGQGIVGHVIESKSQYYVGNAKEDHEHLSSISSAVGFTVRNMLALPLEIRGKVFGVVELINRVGTEGFTDEEVSELAHICSFAAKAIEIRLMLGSKAARSASAKEAA